MKAENIDQDFKDFSKYSFIIANIFLFIYCLILFQRMRIFKDRMNKKHKNKKNVMKNI